ncbi:hypothetical protein D9758_007913 [Tetrapyrgos nigripes]|uniref:Uncharacterized protein n=1 Tax=Tetrapyrgos nigripes TaxID=182062 RepID=A0A8H5D3H5_9AGAR|nr:hypothetical protein D9758_007913 [Tetrapyrgos nigripes]
MDMEPNEAEMEIVGSQKIPDGVDAEIESADAGESNQEKENQRRRRPSTLTAPSRVPSLPPDQGLNQPVQRGSQLYKVAYLSKPDPQTQVIIPEKAAKTSIHRGRATIFETETTSRSECRTDAQIGFQRPAIIFEHWEQGPGKGKGSDRFNCRMRTGMLSLKDGI